LVNRCEGKHGIGGIDQRLAAAHADRLRELLAGEKPELGRGAM
jgi:hypothetical protein